MQSKKILSGEVEQHMNCVSGICTTTDHLQGNALAAVQKLVPLCTDCGDRVESDKMQAVRGAQFNSRVDP